MNCNEFANRILAGLGPALTAEEQTAGELHLVQCPPCRTLKAQLEALDVSLSAAVKAPKLSADFQKRLAERIHSQETSLSAAQREERKRQLQAEYDAGMERFRRAWFEWPSLLAGFQFVLLAAVVGGVVWLFAPQLISLLGAQGVSHTGQTLCLAGLTGLLFLALGLAAAFPRSFRQFSSLP